MWVTAVLTAWPVLYCYEWRMRCQFSYSVGEEQPEERSWGEASGAGAFQTQWRHSLTAPKQEKQSEPGEGTQGHPRVQIICRMHSDIMLDVKPGSQGNRSGSGSVQWSTEPVMDVIAGTKSLNFSAAPAEGDRILLVRTFSHTALFVQFSFNTAQLHYCRWHWAQANIGAQIPGIENSIGKVS